MGCTPRLSEDPGGSCPSTFSLCLTAPQTACDQSEIQHENEGLTKLPAKWLNKHYVFFSVLARIFPGQLAVRFRVDEHGARRAAHAVVCDAGGQPAVEGAHLAPRQHHKGRPQLAGLAANGVPDALRGRLGLWRVARGTGTVISSVKQFLARGKRCPRSNPFTPGPRSGSLP